jgi:hypothetical protein
LPLQRLSTADLISLALMGMKHPVTCRELTSCCLRQPSSAAFALDDVLGGNPTDGCFYCCHTWTVKMAATMPGGLCSVAKALMSLCTKHICTLYL